MRLWRRRLSGGFSHVSQSGIVNAYTGTPEDSTTFSYGFQSAFCSAAICKRNVTYYCELDILTATYNSMLIGLRDTVNTSRYVYNSNSGGWAYYYQSSSSGASVFNPGDTVGVKILNERVYTAVNGGAFRDRAFYDGYSNCTPRLYFSLEAAGNSLTVRLDPSTFKYPQSGCSSFPLS